MTDGEIDASVRDWYQRMADDDVMTDEEIERMVRSGRGRWMVVEEDGSAFRFRQLTTARRTMSMYDRAGIRSRLLRWSRHRVRYSSSAQCFVITDERWLP